MSTVTNRPNGSVNAPAGASPSDDHAPLVKFDFPTWLPPMLVKELRQGLRTRGFVGSMVGFQVVMVIAFVWAFAVNIFGESNALQAVNGFFWSVVGILLLGITPIRAMAGLRQEIESKSLDLLMLTNLTSWRIVLGKWASLMAQSALLLMAFLPFGVVRYFFGSVDLLSDVAFVSLLFLGCGVLTAVALWVSGLPKILRFGLPVVFFFGFQALAAAVFPMNRLVRMFSSGGGVETIWLTLLVVYNLILLMAFCMVRAVRRISPPSDNHSPITRGLAFATLVPVPLLLLWPSHGNDVAVAQLWIGIFVLALVTVLEIWTLQIPMGIHVRRWWGRNRWRTIVGGFVLPGWPSAAFFAAFWLVIVGLTALLGIVKLPSADPLAMAWLFVLLWTALVFPMVLLSFTPNLGRQAPFVYFILQAALAVLALIEGNASNDGLYNPVVVFIRELIHWLPISSFWLQSVSLTVFPADKGTHLVGQAVMVIIVSALAAWRMVFYWRWVRAQSEATRRPRVIIAETGTAE